MLWLILNVSNQTDFNLNFAIKHLYFCMPQNYSNYMGSFFSFLFLFFLVDPRTQSAATAINQQIEMLQTSPQNSQMFLYTNLPTRTLSPHLPSLCILPSAAAWPIHTPENTPGNLAKQRPFEWILLESRWSINENTSAQMFQDCPLIVH